MRVASDSACKLSICTQGVFFSWHVSLDMLLETSQLSGVSFAP